MRFQYLALVGLGALIAGCGEGRAGSDKNDNQCPPGHEAQGPACVPLLDPCPGPAEVPVLGGGCRQVGVVDCGAGFLSDGAGGCEPVLPPGEEGCPPGTMELVGETECQPVGVIACVAGFVPDGEGGCDPLLPPGEEGCPPGTMELLGETECQPVGDCGPAPEGWGNIQVDQSTLFVDTSADATGADGSQAHPFTTLEAAYAVVANGGQIAVAAGDYVTRLVVDRPVRITGRCAQRVVLRGTRALGEDQPPIRITSGGGGSILRGVTLTGDAEGLGMDGAGDVSVMETQILNAGGPGVDARRGSISLHRVVVAGNGDFGLLLTGVETTISESVIRDQVAGASGRYGRGINAQCYPGGVGCGRLALSRSIVARNAEVGVFLVGPEAAITGSVISGTVPGATNRFGRGVSAQCDTGEAFCGRFEMTGALVSGNAELGLYLSGVEATVTGSVIRDSVADASGAGGWGIEAVCSPADLGCGSLEVLQSALVGNREVGALVVGVDAAFRGSIVAGTLPGSRNQGGCGLGAQCGARGAGCAPLEVTGSLVTGNPDVGIFLSGVEATITGVVVTGTMPGSGESSTWGIGAQCDPGRQACGRLELRRSLLTRNFEHGLFQAGVDTVIGGSVVSDTRPNLQGELGRGVHAQCDPNGQGCGSMAMHGSYVTRNAALGIGLLGVPCEITSTVISDNVPGPWGGLGRGIEALCDPGDSSCGAVKVSNSLLSGNAEVGLLLGGIEATITDSVIRDTVPPSGGDFGRGVNAQCHPELPVCGRLVMTGSLVARSREVGIFLEGVETTITGSAVRDTLPGLSQEFGRGIDAQCDPQGRGCGSLDVGASLVTRSHDVGVYVSGVPTTLSSVAITDTRQNTDGPWAQDLGQGVFAMCDEVVDVCSTLTMTACLTEGSFSAGVATQGVSGFIQESTIRQVAPRELDGRYGYGLQVEGSSLGSSATLHVQRCQVLDATLAGILYVGAGGTVSGSVVSGADFSVVMNVGSPVQVTSDNDLSGTYKSEATWHNLEPSPAPPPALPMLEK